MKIIFVLLLLLLPNLIFSQESITSFLSERCDIYTDGSGKSIGLKIKLSVPCTWREEVGDRPHIIKKYSYYSGNDFASSMLFINKMPEALSKEDIDELFSQNGLKELCKKHGTFISGKRIKIDGQDCGEINFKTVKQTTLGTIYLYYLQYYITYKDKLIILGYLTGSSVEEQAEQMFDEYNVLFRVLAGKTVLLSKWE